MSNRRIPDAIRQQIAARLSGGEPDRVVARELGLSPRFMGMIRREFGMAPSTVEGRPSPKKGRVTEVTPDWPQHKVDRLKVLWTEGHSMSEIGRRMGGIGKNAICGKVHRLNLAARPSPINRSGNGRKPQVRRVKPREATLPGVRLVTEGGRPVTEGGRPVTEGGRPVVMAPEPIPVRVGRVQECCYPLTSGKPWLFCNADSVPGKAMCAEHQARCFVRHDTLRAGVGR